MITRTLEALFKTIKHRPRYPFKGFCSLDDARYWYTCLRYITEHLHSGINFITLITHHGLDKAVTKRTKVYELARAKHPERWSGDIRDWSLPDYVCLNPMSETEVKKFINAKEISLKQV